MKPDIPDELLRLSGMTVNYSSAIGYLVIYHVFITVIGK